MKTISPNVFCRRLLSGTTVIVLAMSLGCESNPDALSFDAVAKNPTPELKSTQQRPVDADRQIAYMRDVNRRAVWDDLSRTMYFDHPTRLTPWPVASMSGQPR